MRSFSLLVVFVSLSSSTRVSLLDSLKPTGGESLLDNVTGGSVLSGFEVKKVRGEEKKEGFSVSCSGCVESSKTSMIFGMSVKQPDLTPEYMFDSLSAIFPFSRDVLTALFPAKTKEEFYLKEIESEAYSLLTSPMFLLSLQRNEKSKHSSFLDGQTIAQKVVPQVVLFESLGAKSDANVDELIKDAQNSFSLYKSSELLEGKSFPTTNTNTNNNNNNNRLPDRNPDSQIASGMAKMVASFSTKFARRSLIQRLRPTIVCLPVNIIIPGVDGRVNITYPTTPQLTTDDINNNSNSFNDEYPLFKLLDFRYSALHDIGEENVSTRSETYAGSLNAEVYIHDLFLWIIDAQRFLSNLHASRMKPEEGVLLDLEVPTMPTLPTYESPPHSDIEKLIISAYDDGRQYYKKIEVLVCHISGNCEMNTQNDINKTEFIMPSDELEYIGILALEIQKFSSNTMNSYIDLSDEPNDLTGFQAGEHPQLLVPFVYVKTEDEYASYISRHTQGKLIFSCPPLNNQQTFSPTFSVRVFDRDRIIRGSCPATIVCQANLSTTGGESGGFSSIYPVYPPIEPRIEVMTSAARSKAVEQAKPLLKHQTEPVMCGNHKMLMGRVGEDVIINVVSSNGDSYNEDDLVRFTQDFQIIKMNIHPFIIDENEGGISQTPSGKITKTNLHTNYHFTCPLIPKRYYLGFALTIIEAGSPHPHILLCRSTIDCGKETARERKGSDTFKPPEVALRCKNPTLFGRIEDGKALELDLSNPVNSDVFEIEILNSPPGYESVLLPELISMVEVSAGIGVKGKLPLYCRESTKPKSPKTLNLQIEAKIYVRSSSRNIGGSTLLRGVPETYNVELTKYPTIQKLCPIYLQCE